MQKTYKELQTQLLSKTKSNENLKKRISTLRERLARSTRLINSLSIQYEKVIKEHRKTIEDLLNNGWKILLVKLIRKYHTLKGW